MEFKKFIFGTDFECVNNRIRLLPSGIAKLMDKHQKLKIKKITGSRIGAILGVDEYKSPFQVWCDMLGFYKSEMEQFFVLAGQAIEPKLREFAEFKTNYKFQVHNPISVQFDVFKQHTIFGGLPDGEPVNARGVIDYEGHMPMLEIKTVSRDEYEWTKINNELFLVREDDMPIIKARDTKLKKWFDHHNFHISLSYQYQLGLYLYLRNTTRGLFCVGFLKTQDYLAPQKFDPFKGENLVALAEFQIDLVKFQSVVDYATQWYHCHIDGYISPEMSSVDREWFRFGYPEI